MTLAQMRAITAGHREVQATEDLRQLDLIRTAVWGDAGDVRAFAAGLRGGTVQEDATSDALAILGLKEVKE